MSEGKALVFIAPSGGGKSTLISKLKDDFPELLESVSCTTRSPREGEKEGVHYFYISTDEFESKIKTNDFIEWAKVHENYYGTSKEFVSDCIENGKVVILDIDVQGADAVKEIFKDSACCIFIQPPSFEVLEQRLRGRGTDSEDVIAVRLENASKELAKKDEYDYLITNDDLDRAYDELKTIVTKIIKG